MTVKKYNPMTTEGVALLVKKLANKFWKQACALNLRDLQFEDIEQEIWVTWCRCLKSFNVDNEVGAQFSTYFVRAALLNMQRFLRNQVRDTIEIAPVSAQDFVSEEGEPYEPSFFEVCHVDPERQLSGNEELDRAWNMLSPLAQQVLRLALNPPDDMYEYFAAEEAHEAKKTGIARKNATREGQYEFSIIRVTRYLGLPQSALNIVHQEIDYARRQLR